MNGLIVIKPDREVYKGGELEVSPSAPLGSRYTPGVKIKCGRKCACECEKMCRRTRARKCNCEKKTSKTCVDNAMKKEEVKKFEEKWEKLWKPQDNIIKDASDDFFLFDSRFGPLESEIF